MSNICVKVVIITGDIVLYDLMIVEQEGLVGWS